MIEIDSAWRAAHPLPLPEDGTSKNDRGRLLIVGGAAGVPGAIRLTGEAALRVGAGKVQLATVASAAILLGVAFPEAGIIALPQDDDGEIADDPGALLPKALERADVAVLGPGMRSDVAAGRLVGRIVQGPARIALLLDAAAIACAGALRDALVAYPDPVVMTPHLGEMAALAGCEEDQVRADPAGYAARTARRFDALIVLKGGETIIAAPDGEVLRYEGGGPGLGTGGSGDVLAGVIGGLLARGVAPLQATAWGVWLHGRAGRMLAADQGPIGFLARELLPLLPRLLPR